MYSFHILKEAILLNTMNNFLSACVTGDRGYLKNFKTRVYAIYIEIWFVETFAPNDLNFWCPYEFRFKVGFSPFKKKLFASTKTLKMMKNVFYFIVKVKSCNDDDKQCDRFNTNNKQEIFAYLAVLVFKWSSRKVFFINTKDNTNC